MNSIPLSGTRLWTVVLLLLASLPSLRADPPLPSAIIPLALVQITPDTGASPDDSITQSPQITVHGVALPGIPVELRVDGHSAGFWTPGPDGAWSADLSATPLSHGQHSLTATFGAGVGYRSSTLVVRVDTIPPSNPSFTSVSPDTGASASDWITSATTVAISGRSDPNSTVRLTLDSTELPPVAATADGTWAHTLADIAPGSHTLVVRATDLAGNPSNPVSRTLVIDNSPPPPPTIASLGQDTGTRNDDRITSDTTPTLSGAAEVSSRVRLMSNGQTTGSATANANGQWRFTFPVLADGAYEWTPVAEDAAGNSATGAPFKIIIKSSLAAPTLTISPDTGVPGDWITAVRALVFSGTGEGQLSVVLDGQVIGNPTVEPNGRWTLDHSATPLPNGAHTLVINAFDVAGNKTSTTQSFRVEYVFVPAPPNFFVAWDGKLVSQSATVHLPGGLEVFGKAYTQAATVEVHINQVLRASVSPNPIGEWRALVGSLPEGSYTLQVRGISPNGSPSEFSSPLSFQVAPPLGDPVQIHFDATITEINNPHGVLKFNSQEPDQNPSPEWGITQVGSHLVGSYSYRLNAPDLDPIPSRGHFSLMRPDANLVIDTLGVRLNPALPTQDFLIEDGAGAGSPDRFEIRGSAAFAMPTSIPIDSFELLLNAPSGTAIDEVLLSEFPPELSQWDGRKELIIHGPTDPILGELWSIRAELNSLVNRSLYPSEPPLLLEIVSATSGASSPFGEGDPVVARGWATPNTRVQITFESMPFGTRQYVETQSDDDGFWETTNLTLPAWQYQVTAVTLSPWGTPSAPSNVLYIEIIPDREPPPAPSAPEIIAHNTAPGAPILEFTPLTIQGFAEPNSSVMIYFNGNGYGEVTADASGRYIFENFRGPKAGEYEVVAQARDQLWNIGPESEPTHISMQWPTGATITLSFEAVITTASGNEGSFAENLIPGETITGTFTYRLGAINSDTSAPWTATYQSTAPGAGFILNLGAKQFVTQGGSSLFAVVNDAPFSPQPGSDNPPSSTSVDLMVLNAFSLVDGAGSGWTGYASLFLKDDSGTALSSTALPESAPVLSNWADNVLNIQLDNRQIPQGPLFPPSLPIFLQCQITRISHEVTQP